MSYKDITEKHKKAMREHYSYRDEKLKAKDIADKIVAQLENLGGDLDDVEFIIVLPDGKQVRIFP